MTVFGRSNDFFAFYKTKCARPENRTRLRGFALFFQTFKGNQAMKLGQLIENKMRNIFLEKSYINCGGETMPRSFSKNLKLSISLDP